MNKILQSASTGEINVTNDGATILKAIQLDNPAAKILVNISKVQDDEVGDGTTSVAVLAAELLREAEKMVAQKIHPQTIVEGYRIASAAALKALEKSAVDHAYVFAPLLGPCPINEVNPDLIPNNSARIFLTSHGQHSHQKSCPRIRITLPISLSMPCSD